VAALQTKSQKRVDWGYKDFSGFLTIKNQTKKQTKKQTNKQTCSWEYEPGGMGPTLIISKGFRFWSNGRCAAQEWRNCTVVEHACSKM